MGYVLCFMGENDFELRSKRLPNQICKTNCDFGKNTKHKVQFTNKAQSTINKAQEKKYKTQVTRLCQGFGGQGKL